MVARRALLSIVVILLVFTGPIFSPPAQAQDPCAGLVAPRLSIGGNGRVTSGYGVSLKDKPMTGAAGASEVTLMPFDTVITLVDGPRCNLGYVWWQMQLPDGTVGWAAEGDDTDYFIEPYTVGLHMYWKRPDGAQITHYFVTPDGMAHLQGFFNVAPVESTPRETWQQVEIDLLGQALDTLRANCPDRLAGTIWEGAETLADALGLPLPPLEYDFYPAPTGDRLLLVRHLHLLLPRCDTVIEERVGISNVSLLYADGTETLLFPFPQHGSVPPSEDRYVPGEPDTWSVYLDEVLWSPQAKYIAFVAAYRDQCSSQACYRFHVYVWNTETSQLYVPGEGRHLGWTNAGEGINFFRLISESDRQVAHLYTMRPDGAARQEIWLPGGAVYLSTEQQGLDFPWNASGTRVMVGNAGLAEVMLFDVGDRSFSPVILVPDKMPQVNLLAVYPVEGETALLWATIRGEFAVQNVRTGDWAELQSEVASTGVAPTLVRPFGTGDKALVELADGKSFILDFETDQIAPVTFAE